MADRKNKKTLAQHSEDALYREVWEDVRTQKIYGFVRHHLRLLIVVFAAAMGAAVAVVLFRHVSNSNRIEVARQYESATDMAPNLSREALSRLAQATRDGMGDLALFRAYQLAWDSGDKSDALAKLDKLAAGGATRDFRDLATLQMAYLKHEGLSGDAFQKMMSPLLTKRSPFYFTGLLFVAGKYLSENKPDEAAPLLKKITSDQDAPASISAAAEILMR